MHTALVRKIRRVSSQSRYSLGTIPRIKYAKKKSKWFSEYHPKTIYFFLLSTFNFLLLTFSLLILSFSIEGEGGRQYETFDDAGCREGPPDAIDTKGCARQVDGQRYS